MFAMAGIAEAAAAMVLGIGYCWLFLVGVVVLFAAGFRSRIVAGIALGLLALLTVLAQPWQLFRPVASDDSDVQDWASAERGFATWWVVAVVGVVAVTVWVFAFRPSRVPGYGPALHTGLMARDDHG